MNVVEYKFDGNTYKLNIRTDADESVFAEIFKHHEYRIADTVIKNAVNPIIDIGAHAGFFTIYARSLNPNVKIIAVEPEPENINIIKNHLLLNKITNFELLEGAVAGDSGRRHLELGRDNHNHKLLPRGLKEKGNSIIVNSWSLPDLLKKCIIERVGVLKMDIEGGEYEIFESLNESTLASIGSVILEYHKIGVNNFDMIETILRENGFGVEVFPSKFDKKMGFIFANNKRHKQF